MPFLAVCPDCHYSQVCVLPASTFPRIKCCRCREVYDPIGSEDTEVIPELAGVTLVRHIQARRAARTRAGEKRTRRRQKSGRSGRKSRGVTRSAARELSPDEVAAAVLSAPAPDLATATVISPPAADTEPQANNADTAPDPGAAAPVRGPLPPRPSRRVRPAVPAATPFTAGALFLLGAGLAAASVEGVGFLFRPLAIVSVLVGLWAIRVARREGVPAWYAVTVSTLAAAAVVSFLVPGVLGLVRPSVPEWAENDVQVIPHPQFAADLTVRGAEWVDAGKASLQQGATRIEIVEVWVRGTFGSEELLVRVRRHRQLGIGRAPATGWDERVRASVLDRDGRRYEQVSTRADLGAGPAGAGHTEAFEARDVVLVFPVIDKGSGWRLELPAAAWGGLGTFRFAIPAWIVRR